MNHTATIIDPVSHAPRNLHYANINGWSLELDQLKKQNKLLDWVHYRIQNDLPLSAAVWARVNPSDVMEIKEALEKKNTIQSNNLCKEMTPIIKACTCGAHKTYGKNCSKFYHSQDWCDLFKKV